MGKPRLEQFKEWENRHEFRQGKIFGYKKQKWAVAGGGLWK